MQKRITTTLLFIVLTLTLTQLATAQWIDNEFTNETEGTMYVAFNTLRPAKGAIPEGWRTVGWYRIRAGASHTFQAWDKNPIYYLIWDEDFDEYLMPEDADTYTHWESLKAFVLVSEDETDVNVSRQRLLYSNRDKGTLVRNSDFFKADNGTSVTVSDDGVRLGDTVDRPSEKEVDITITSGSGNTLNQNSTSQLTISVTENGNPAANKTLSLSVDSNKATISPALGATNSSGQLSASLTIDRSATPGTFNVSAAIANTDHSATLPFTVEVGAGQLSISRSPSTVEPGQTANVTVTVRTPGGDPFPNAQVSLAAPTGTINPTLITTNSNGQATSKWTAPQYTGTPHPRTIVDPLITATVIDNPKVTKQERIAVRYIPSSLSVSGHRSSITSGESSTITATVKSKSGKPMQGVSVSFSESSSYLRFSNSRVNTNSSGQAKSTLRTGGQTSSAKFTVSTSGVSARSYTVRINPQIRFTMKFFDHKGALPPIFEGFDIHEHTKTYTAPGRVVDAKVNCTRWNNANLQRVRIRYPSSNQVRVYYSLADATWVNRARLKCKITIKYEDAASTPGAPPLQPQLRPEIDELSSVWQDLSQVPSETALLPNYPNPFNPETWIPYHLSEPANVTLSVYSADGKLVRTLALGHQGAGVYESKSRAAYWDGRNAVGERVASGLYFYTLTAGDFAATGKMLIMK